MNLKIWKSILSLKKQPQEKPLGLFLLMDLKTYSFP
jgi:hypothetical protein